MYPHDVWETTAEAEFGHESFFEDLDIKEEDFDYQGEQPPQVSESELENLSIRGSGTNGFGILSDQDFQSFGVLRDPATPILLVLAAFQVRLILQTGSRQGSWRTYRNYVVLAGCAATQPAGVEESYRLSFRYPCRVL